MTNGILGWPGVVWTARMLLVVVFGGGAWVLLLQLARFFQPRNVLAMLRARPPRLNEVSGEFAGAKASLKFAAQDETLAALIKRIVAVEQAVDMIRQASVEAQALRDSGGGAT